MRNDIFHINGRLLFVSSAGSTHEHLNNVLGGGDKRRIESGDEDRKSREKESLTHFHVHKEDKSVDSHKVSSSCNDKVFAKLENKNLIIYVYLTLSHINRKCNRGCENFCS